MNALGYVLSDEGRQAIVLAMHVLLSEISEANYAAGWMMDVEYNVWQAIHETPPYWNGYQVSEDKAAALRELSTLIDGWLTYDEYVPMAEWQARVEARARA